MINEEQLQDNIESLKDATLVIAFNTKNQKTDWWLTYDDPKKVQDIIVKSGEIPSSKYEGVLSLPGTLLVGIMNTCFKDNLKDIKIETPILEKFLGIGRN
jgi:hypothetical protein